MLCKRLVLSRLNKGKLWLTGERRAVARKLVYPNISAGLAFRRSGVSRRVTNFKGRYKNSSISIEDIKIQKFRKMCFGEKITVGRKRTIEWKLQRHILAQQKGKL